MCDLCGNTITEGGHWNYAEATITCWNCYSPRVKPKIKGGTQALLEEERKRHDYETVPFHESEYDNDYK